MTAVAYPVMEIADAEPVRFPGFDALTLDYPQLQAVIREPPGGPHCRPSSGSN
jgi:hypothetical protein